MAVSIRDDVGLLPGLHGTTFATRCWATSEAAWDSRDFNGDGHCWLSLRLSGHFSSRLNTAAQGWLQTLLCSAKRGSLRGPYSLTASASDAQGRASKNLQGTSGFPHGRILAPAKSHRSQGCQTRCCWGLPALTEQGAAAHVSTLLDVVTTLTNPRAARWARGGPRDIQGCASKSPNGARGCRTHVGRIGLELVWKRQTGLPQKSVWETRCRWQVLRILKVHDIRACDSRNPH